MILNVRDRRRLRLPNRRDAETFHFEFNGLSYTATVGRYENDAIGELFLSNQKQQRSEKEKQR